MLLHTPPPRKVAISLTPLIDVVFILLVFFMLASSFLNWRTYEVSTQVDASSAAVKVDEEPDIARLSLLPNGRWQLDGEDIETKAAIQQISQRHKSASAKFLVHILPEPQANVQHIVTALDAMREAQIEKVSLRAPPEEATP